MNSNTAINKSNESNKVKSTEKVDPNKRIFEAVKNGKNVFMTGPGGTGKSYNIKNIYKYFVEINKKVSVTSLTGVASVLLASDAITLHSWSGIGLGLKNKTKSEIIHKILNSKLYRYNWENTEVLIVDEISMMSMELFDLLNEIGKAVKRNDKPFGGIQLIFSGDFFQLPPVGENTFCFESENFLSTFDDVVILSKVYRQKDILFRKILLNMRKGLISKKSIEIFKSRIISSENVNITGKNNEEENNEDITRLVPTKKKAQEINDYYLNKIKSKKYVYKRTYKNSKENLTQKQKMKAFLVTDFERENEFNYLKNNTLTEETLNLKVGAFVMCVSNLCLEQGVSNGSIGKVIDFENKYPVVQFEKCKLTIGLKEFKSENIPGISIYQVPLILAWSITIHKSQGLTLERAIIDVGNDIFEGGQMYVALSRIQSLKGLYLKEFDLNSLKINKKVLDFYSYLENTY